MRISDWSSDVCSSDLLGIGERGAGTDHAGDREGEDHRRPRAIRPHPGQRIDAGAHDGADAQRDQMRPAQRLGQGLARLVRPDVVERLARTEHSLLRSEENTSELQSLMRISYAVFCLKKKTKIHTHNL